MSRCFSFYRKSVMVSILKPFSAEITAKGLAKVFKCSMRFYKINVVDKYSGNLIYVRYLLNTLSILILIVEVSNLIGEISEKNQKFLARSGVSSSKRNR